MLLLPITIRLGPKIPTNAPKIKTKRRLIEILEFF
jgi:hypothetical protein